MVERTYSSTIQTSPERVLKPSMKDNRWSTNPVKAVKDLRPITFVPANLKKPQTEKALPTGRAFFILAYERPALTSPLMGEVRPVPSPSRGGGVINSQPPSHLPF